MSEAVSALNGASYDGFVAVADAGLRGMITVRGDLANVDLKNAVTGVTGVDFPAERGINQVGVQGIAWMSPDELLVMVAYDKVGEVIATLKAALTGQHHLIANVSDARAVFTVTGPGAREVLAKLSPYNVEGLEAGQIARSRAAQVAAAFWMTGEDAFELVSFRSTATYTFNLLKNAAKPGGEVGYF